MDSVTTYHYILSYTYSYPDRYVTLMLRQLWVLKDLTRMCSEQGNLVTTVNIRETFIEYEKTSNTEGTLYKLFPVAPSPTKAIKHGCKTETQRHKKKDV
jgi:hypothetical protein